jgi:hypothetical protein
VVFWINKVIAKSYVNLIQPRVGLLFVNKKHHHPGDDLNVCHCHIEDNLNLCHMEDGLNLCHMEDNLKKHNATKRIKS